ncbi:Histone H2A.Z-specific chaperone [Maudiozyma exigua]|uniref:Histone H2A.Z-specific chaperone CHZ1 n=1 Tax=Maudiozyma exigua TaxID=34358 RepID=A0A9P6WDS4_MAUEX|nr:Histone H2A.Z-specific chaperone [Kazachstania exigua]
MSDAEKTVDPSKKRRRRRNYDDYDNEVAQEEKTLKESKKTKLASGETIKGTDTTKNTSESQEKALNGDENGSDSDVDDEKLDRLMGNELDEEEDDLNEIDTSNIITGGRRTRGKIIDYKKAAKELDSEEKGADASKAADAKGLDDEDDEDDVEFKA